MILVSSDNVASIEVNMYPDFLAIAIGYIVNGKIVVITIKLEKKEI